MFIMVEKTMRGSVLLGRTKLPATPSRSGKVINAERLRWPLEEGRRRIKVLLRGSISFWFTGNLYFYPNTEQGSCYGEEL